MDTQKFFEVVEINNDLNRKNKNLKFWKRALKYWAGKKNIVNMDMCVGEVTRCLKEIEIVYDKINAL